MDKKRRNAIIGNVVLLIISIVIISVTCIFPLINNTGVYTNDNTFKHSVTVEYTEINKDTDVLYIHIKENEKTILIGMGWLKNKPELEPIKKGDIITFWTYLTDTYNMTNVDFVSVCAFSINNIPIVTIEERSRIRQESMARIRILGIVLAAILESIGVFLLVRAFRKQKNNSVDNMEESDGNGKT